MRRLMTKGIVQISHSRSHLIASAVLECCNEAQALRFALKWNWKGWNTCRIEKCDEGSYLVQLSRLVLTQMDE